MGNLTLPFSYSNSNYNHVSTQQDDCFNVSWRQLGSQMAKNQYVTP